MSRVRRWQPGQPITDGHLNETVDAVNAIGAGSLGSRSIDLRRAAVLSRGLILKVGIVQSSTAVTASNDANGNPTQWTYTIKRAQKTAAGYGGWSVAGDAEDLTAYNFMEDQNTGTGAQGNGVDHDGDDYPAGFAMQPIPDDQPVLYVDVLAPSGNAWVTEAWIVQVVNGEDGTCEAP